MGSIPRILIIGPGGCGKDTVAGMLAARTGWPNLGSISWHMRGMVARALGLTEAEAWATRREHRCVWRDLINSHKAQDPARLVREILHPVGGPGGGILTGVRPRLELEASRALVDWVLWVERPDCPADPTLELRRADADFTIQNSGTLAQLERVADAWGAKLNSCWRAKTAVGRVERAAPSERAALAR